MTGSQLFAAYIVVHDAAPTDTFEFPQTNTKMTCHGPPACAFIPGVCLTRSHEKRVQDAIVR